MNTILINPVEIANKLAHNELCKLVNSEEDLYQKDENGKLLDYKVEYMEQYIQLYEDFYNILIFNQEDGNTL